MKFNIKDKVSIKQLDWDGIILAIFIGETGIQYKVRYFYNGDAKEIYFYEEELQLKEL